MFTLDFWGPISYLNEQKKYVLVVTDRFSRWPSAMVTTTNTSDKVLKFLDKYIYQHGVPRRIHVDQGPCFTFKKFKSFCNSEGIELIYSPVNDQLGAPFEAHHGSEANTVLRNLRKKPSPKNLNRSTVFVTFARKYISTGKRARFYNDWLASKHSSTCFSPSLPKPVLLVVFLTSGRQKRYCFRLRSERSN